MTARPSDTTARSNEWEFRLAGGYWPVGMYISVEIKNVRTGQVRTGLFLGGGVLNLEYVKSSRFRTGWLQSLIQDHRLEIQDSPNDWVRFRTRREIDFSEFDGARAIFRGDPQLDYFIGPTHFQLEFPDLDPGHSIDFGEFPVPSRLIAGVNISENIGIWKEMGLTTLG
jgi:hypothetical protein